MYLRRAIVLGFCSMALSVPAQTNTAFQFKNSSRQRLIFNTNAAPAALTGRPARVETLRGHQENDPAAWVESNRRLIVRLRSGTDVTNLAAGLRLEVARQVTPDAFILQAEDAPACLKAAETLSLRTDVTACEPILRESWLKLQAPLAAIPNDPFYGQQWHLDQLNIRAAWTFTRGSGQAIGFGDDGVDFTHPDLGTRAGGMVHSNFLAGTTNGLPSTTNDNHGTVVAGLAVAEMNNATGVVGIAPEAKLASYKIFNDNLIDANAEYLMDMFQFQNQTVGVQNHSWGNEQVRPKPIGTAASIGIDNAIANGRDGKGIIFVRSVPNRRSAQGDANDDGYPSDPRAIAVAGINQNGRVAAESAPGACILVAAGGGEAGVSSVLATDRVGTNGFNTAASPTGDYSRASGLGAVGTSFAAPQIAGLSALLLAANTNLTYRDIQQILILSSRSLETNDVDLGTNGAGFYVSHNTGYGTPDAAVAISLAKTWSSRPALTNVTVEMNQTNSVSPLDDGLRVEIAGAPGGLASLAASPGIGKNVEDATAYYPLVDVGQAITPLTTNLTGKAALIGRGGATFTVKAKNAADAGAAFAIIFNNTGTTNRTVMSGLEYIPIPVVLISTNDGISLKNHLASTNANATARIKLHSTNFTFTVTDALRCEHVAVYTEVNCRRSDVRLVLTSPQGTRSVLQHVNVDGISGLNVWTYTSTHHFFENTAGTWTLTIADENPGVSSTLHTASLIFYGTPLTDTDHDNLDDAWETAKFGSLSATAQADPDNDGFNNLREAIIGTSPTVPNGPVITQQPGSVAVAPGSNTTFSVQANGLPLLSYQWLREGTNLSGATASALSLTNVQAAQAGTYSVVVSNAADYLTSVGATLTVSMPVSLTVQPASRTVQVGSNVTLSVTATGGAPLAYQWRWNGTNVSAATNSAYTLNGFLAAQTGLYSVLVSNAVSSVLSTNAELLVAAPLRFGSFGWGVSNQFQFQIIGTAGSNYVLHFSSNLVQWLPLSTNLAPNGLLYLTDTNAAGKPHRFYKVTSP